MGRTYITNQRRGTTQRTHNWKHLQTASNAER